MKKLGVIINPVAGMGGRVGLKGSDGIDILAKARELGAKPEAPKRAVEALKVISRLKGQIEVLAYASEMGEQEAREAGFNPQVIGQIKSGETTSDDTMKAACDMVKEGVDLILFAGGDGTARNIYSAIGDKDIPVLGIPAGVKIHSAVYAINPKSAGEAAALFLEGKVVNIRESEVMDIDEDAFRQGRVSATLYGYLRVPEEKRFVQSVKSGTHSEKAAIGGMAADVAANMEEDVLYIIGPGTTTRSVMERLELPNTLLGIDVVMNKKLLASDVTEQKLWSLIEAQDKVKIIVTAIGGQGHVFGRGNQQISPRVIRKVGRENIIIVASKDKLVSLMPRPLLLDTGDPDLDAELCGYYRVIQGWQDFTMYKLGV